VKSKTLRWLTDVFYTVVYFTQTRDVALLLEAKLVKLLPDQLKFYKLNFEIYNV